MTTDLVCTNKYPGFTEARRDYIQTVGERILDYEYSVKPEDVPTRLERMFRSSFPLSNGSPLLQFFLLDSGLELMNITIGDDETSKEAMANVKLDPRKFYPPGRHADYDTGRLDTRITDIWNVFSTLCYNQDDIYGAEEFEDLDPDEWKIFKATSNLGLQQFAIIDIMLLKDIQWVTVGRPKQESEYRKRQSMFRKHVFELKPSGSPELDYSNRISKESLKYILESDNQTFVNICSASTERSIKSLSHVWEQQNTQINEPFLPSEFARFFGKPLLNDIVENEDWIIV